MAIQSTSTDEGLLRLKGVLQLIPISRSHFLAGVAEGKYPQPVKLGPRVTCWRRRDILNYIDELGPQQQEAGARS